MDSKFFMQVIVPISILLPIFLGIIHYNKLSEAAKIVLFYLFIAALSSGVSIFIAKYWHKNKMPVIHVFTILELVMIVIFYKKIFAIPAKNSFYNLIIIVFTNLGIVNAIFFQSIYTYNSYTRSLEAIICILFSINYFAILSADPSSKKLLRHPYFYFNAGFFLYFSGAFMFFVFSNFIISNLSLYNFRIIWTIHAILLLLMYLFFAIAFMLWKR